MAIALQSLGRFRINLYRQRGSVARVGGYIKSEISLIEPHNRPRNLNLKELNHADAPSDRHRGRQAGAGSGNPDAQTTAAAPEGL